MLVPTKRTVCTDQELANSLVKCWKQLYNEVPKKESICIVLAQHKLETGNNDCWNWNLCNVKYVAANGNVDYMALNGVWEIINGKRVNLPPTDPGSWFRSFNTLDEGTVFYLNFLNSGRYKNAFAAIIAGDPAQYSHLLKIDGFYTADEKQYTSVVVAFFNQFMKSIDYQSAISTVQPPPDETVIKNTTQPVSTITNLKDEDDTITQPDVWGNVLDFLKKLIFKK